MKGSTDKAEERQDKGAYYNHLFLLLFYTSETIQANICLDLQKGRGKNQNQA